MRNKDGAGISPDLAKAEIDRLRILVLGIKASFLKGRAISYVQASHDFLKSIEAGRPSAGLLRQFGKQARILDLVLAVAATSGYLSAGDKMAAQEICQMVGKQLDRHTQRQDNGIIFLATPQGDVRAETHSVIGRRLAGLFARIVPPTRADQTSGHSTRPSYLPEDVVLKIRDKLKAAEALCRRGRVAEAMPVYKDILAMDRKNPEAIRALGMVYLECGQCAAGIPLLEEALLFYPEDTLLLSVLGEALAREGRYPESIARHREAVGLNPDEATFLAKFGKSLVLGGYDTEALAVLERAVQLAPKSVEAIGNLGLCLHIMQQLDKAALQYLKALKLSPRNTFILANMGVLRGQQRKNLEGIKLLDKALAIDPEDPHLSFMKSQLLLAEGDYQRGWALYEAGLGSREFRGAHLIADKPVWTGEPSPDMRLLIHKEQGLGDMLQFIRYAALCKQRVGKVYVVCAETLVRLFEQIPFIDGVFTAPPASGKYDAQISVMSLPYIFGSTPDNVPHDLPYLFVPPAVQNKWAPRFNSGDHAFRVGIVWSGSMFVGRLRGNERAKHRNMDLVQLKPLLDCENTSFYSLQMGDFARQLDLPGFRDRIIDYMSDVGDMADTAAIIEKLDLVITVDTSVAHLAGGLGKPVWILSRFDGCWRWLNNQPQSPWYPEARIFGQPRPRDWETVVVEVEKALRERVTARRG